MPESDHGALPGRRKLRGFAPGALHRALALSLLFCAATARAAEVAEAPRSGIEFFMAGGRLMWAILLCSVVVVAFTMERAFACRRKKLIDEKAYDDIRSAVDAGELKDALAVAGSGSTPMGRVLAGVLASADGTRAEMETLLEDAGARELWELQRNTKPIGIVSNVAPLLGLLGTVVGIIRAFSDVATQPDAIGNPQILATGIYEALITTAAGLSVAIPSYLLYHYFRGKAEAAIKEIEEKSLALISGIMQNRAGGTAART